jgi:hypothetical protein
MLLAFSLLKTGYLYVVQAGFELAIFLSQLAECWDYMYEPPHLLAYLF